MPSTLGERSVLHFYTAPAAGIERSCFVRLPGSARRIEDEGTVTAACRKPVKKSDPPTRSPGLIRTARADTHRGQELAPLKAGYIDADHFLRNSVFRLQSSDGPYIFFVSGSGSLSAPKATLNSRGYATVTLTVTNLSASFQVNACVAPNNNPCQNIYGTAVPGAMLNLQPVAGAGQLIAGSAFQPLTVRVTDSSSPPNPVLGANVLFQSMVLRPAGNNLALTTGDSPTNSMPVILSSTQTSVQSNSNGLASVTPSVGSFTGTLEIEIQISAGASALLQDVMESLPETYFGSNPSPSGSSPSQAIAPRPVGLPARPTRLDL